MTDIFDAIGRFPIIQWLSKHCKVADSGGENIYTDCPVCGGERKLGISREKKIGHCFRCNDGGHGGDVWTGTAGLIKLVCIFEKIPPGQAIEFIYNYVGFDPPVHRKVAPAEKLPKEAHPLKGRDDHASSEWLRGRNMSHLVEHSYVCVSGHYAGRVILPCLWLGEVVAFEAKTYTGQTPKALYPPWFETGQYLYTTRLFKPELGIVTITESILDAETVKLNAVGLYGSTLKEGQLARLLELRALGVTRLVWMLDWDAWRKQAKAILKTAGMFENYVVNVPPNQDPNSLGTATIREVLSTATRVHNELDLIEVAGKFGREIFDFT